MVLNMQIIRTFTEEAFLVQCPGNKRDKNTLHSLISQYVRRGTHIITDSWKGYNDITSLGYTHSLVNHSEEFVSSEDPSVHTQSIEGLTKQMCLEIK